jgi:hypothetical protein
MELGTHGGRSFVADSTKGCTREVGARTEMSEKRRLMTHG